ncbi:MAG: acyl-CoA dehydrogenase family protein [Actinomycetales bacterium]
MSRSIMQFLDSETQDFAASVAGTLDQAGWADATCAETAQLPPLWDRAVDQGWFDLGGAGELGYLAAAVRELGLRACPLPIVDGYVLAHLAALSGQDDLCDQVARGQIRVVLSVHDGPQVRHDELVEVAGRPTHLLHLQPASGRAVLYPIGDLEPVGGLAVPNWGRAHVVSDAGEAGQTTAPAGRELAWSVEQVRYALHLYRLGLAVRMLAAAERAHTLAVEHAQVRQQFGRVIGAFGAVQQRVAQAQIDLDAGWSLVADLLARYADHHIGDGFPSTTMDFPLRSELAIRFASDHAVGVHYAAQHTLGAIGYFTEHEAPWTFRAVHADQVRLRASQNQHTDVATLALVRGLPGLGLGRAAEEFRGEVRAMLDEVRDSTGVIDAEALRERMDKAGWFSLGWPAQVGGGGAPVELQAVLAEELKYAGGPVDRAMSASALLGHSIARHGSPAQQAEFLPLLRAGTMAFCLGYSEPEAGSDLASLRTRARPVDGGWLITGQKTWTTRAHTATHIWLAVRTDPDASPRQAGITILLVPMDTPGIEVQRHQALSGEISCSVFFDDVWVTDAARVGPVNGGWTVIIDALAAERVVMGGVVATLLSQLDDLLELVRERPDLLGGNDSHQRDQLSRLAARMQAARCLVLAATRKLTGGAAAPVAARGQARQAAMAAVLGGDVAEEFGEVALLLLGPAATLSTGAPGALAEGRFEAGLRLAPMYVIGGGTNDIQRGLIARSLGLPRE